MINENSGRDRSPDNLMHEARLCKFLMQIFGIYVRGLIILA
jgi:hypothetical protein